MSIILKNLNIVSIYGKCSLGSSHTIQGFPISYSDNFQGYPFLSGNGQCLCPPCNYFLKNQDFRKKNWVASEDGIRFLQRRECQDIILSPPSPPFFFYITQSGQRQGWLDALQIVNYSREKFIISTDWVGKFFLERNTAIELISLCTQLRKLKLSKSSLRTGLLSPAEYRRALENHAEKLVQEIHRWKNTPIWEVIVYVSE
jgi:CRISPR type IV-associated protein Csf1